MSALLLIAQLRGLNIPVQRVPKEKLNRITVKNHQGIVVPFAYLLPAIGRVNRSTYEAGETPPLVALTE